MELRGEYREASAAIEKHLLGEREERARGERTFHLVDAKESGLSMPNPYDDPRMWGDRYLEFTEGAVGTGICAGDYDGDGWTDLYVVGRTRPNRLFRQVAPLRFEDATERAGVAGGADWGTGACFLDIDDDGDLDLYACHYYEANRLYINEGDGRFSEQAARFGLDIAASSVMPSIADYDRDGDLDIYIVTNKLDAEAGPYGDPDYLMRNDGPDGFVEATAYAGMGGRHQGHSATWGDWNGDGWPDLYVANDFRWPDELYMNQGYGQFEEASYSLLPNTPYFSMGCDYADIDNDGLMDLYVADMAGSTRKKRLATLGNLNPQVVLEKFDRMAVPQVMRNTLFLNTGADRFMEIGQLAGVARTDWTWSVRFGDLDNDGWEDLFVANGQVRAFTDTDLLERVVGKPLAHEVGVMRRSDPLKEANFAFRNLGDLGFEDASRRWNLDTVGIAFGAVLADLDRDGDLDIVTSNWEVGPMLYRNDAAEGRGLLVELRGEESNAFGVGARLVARAGGLTLTRDLFPTRGAVSGDEPVVHFGLGGHDRLERLTVRWPSGVEQEFENLRVGYRYTIREEGGRGTEDGRKREQPEPWFAEKSIERGLYAKSGEEETDEMTLQPLLPFRQSMLGPSMAWGDANGDGRWDLYVGGPAGAAGKLLLAREDGFFESAGIGAWTADLLSEDMASLWLDADSDGDQDLFVASGGVEHAEGSPQLRNRLYMNHGDGSFARAGPEELPARATNSSMAAAGDFDRDGDLDLFIGGGPQRGLYPQAAPSALWENRGGSFVAVTATVAPELAEAGLARSALWSDADGDGWLDLHVATEWGPPRLYRNVGGKRLEERTEELGLGELSGWWQSVAAGDFNGDGRLDYVLGNMGLNTRYESSSEAPLRLLAGFRGRRDGALLEALSRGGEWYPLSGLNDLAAQWPGLRSRFPSHADYAGLTLEEVRRRGSLGEAELGWEIGMLESGILLSGDGGGFAFAPLPRMAQAAPVCGIEILDLNGDGHDDLVLAQNYFGPRVTTGRFDGGVGMVLLGDGGGGFEALGPRRSGFLVVGDATALAAADWNADGWADLAVGRNRQSTLAFERRPPEGKRSVAIAIRGKPGNLAAVGAKVFVTAGDGSSRLKEISAGAGYMSQAAPLLFVSYAASQPPVSIRVVWPDGGASLFEWAEIERLGELAWP